MSMFFERLFRFNRSIRLSSIALALGIVLIPASFLYANPPAPAATPAPPPATATAEGTLTIITDPERVEVWINENYAGLTPIRDKRLPEGTYTLRLVDALRQNSASETIVISEGERLLVERSLGGSYGKLRVDTDPQGADVAIIAELGKTPLVNEYLTPGQYRLEIRHPNDKYLSIMEEVTFAADGKPVIISHKLEKPPVFTTKRLIQVGLGAGAIGGWVYAINRYHNDDQYKDTNWRPITAIAVAAVLSAALQVTIFIW